MNITNLELTQATIEIFCGLCYSSIIGIRSLYFYLEQDAE